MHIRNGLKFASFSSLNPARHTQRRPTPAQYTRLPVAHNKQDSTRIKLPLM